MIRDPMPEAENWKIALERYDGHPIAALTLAYQLIGLKQCLERSKRGIPDAVAGLDLAIESLYAHTDFDKMGRSFTTEQSKTNLSLIRQRNSVNSA